MDVDAGWGRARFWLCYSGHSSGSQLLPGIHVMSYY